MGTISIQRLIEQHAAAHGDRTAILDQHETVSYRELNARANGVARRLMASGFRRSAYAIVRMPRGIDLAVVLLGVLKAGGSYTWFDPATCGDRCPAGVSFRTSRHRADERFLSVDLGCLLANRTQPNPNLPILTRGSDIACVLTDADGSAAVLVPHATIASLVDRALPFAGRWTGEAGAVDLWLGLMSGEAVAVDDQPAHAAVA